jgi:hypothetical protein
VIVAFASVSLTHGPRVAIVNSERVALLKGWATSTTAGPALLEDPRWTDLLGDIISGQPLIRWLSGGEDGLELPAGVPAAFLEQVQAAVYDEEGVDVDHLDEVYPEFP